MLRNKTFTIIKPEVIARGDAGKVLQHIIDAGFRIRAMKLVKMSKEQAADFYVVHKEKAFFNELIEYMSSGPVIVAVLEKDNAVEEFRKTIGATNPKDAEKGTIREIYGKSILENAIHGSDSDENAFIESHFFFSDIEFVL